MERVLKEFTKEYDLRVAKRIFSGETQRSANNPILFICIGDKTKAASEYISKSINKKWDNGRGIVFINVLSDSAKDKDNIFNFQLNYGKYDKKTLRKDISDKFYSDKKILESFNNKITAVRDELVSNGGLFNSFESINISVITMSDEPFNILVPEITILIREKILEVFKLCTTDLYILIKEKNVEDEFFSKAVTLSFFREIEYMQKDSFKFNERIAVYGENRELPVTWSGAVFYMTYVLEEKNEKGIILDWSMNNNYEIIPYINLLKNRNVSIETYSDTENQYYDNSRFKANINIDNSINRYITAGLSKVRRPNDAIAVTVLRAFYEIILKKFEENSRKDQEVIAQILKIDEDSINSKLEYILPKKITVADMNGIMISNNSSSIEKRLSKCTIKQIEETLYKDRCQSFFYNNFTSISEEKLSSVDLEKEMRCLVLDNILNDNKLGLYCAFRWTFEDGEAIKYLRNKIDSINRHIESINSEIENIYESKFIEGFSFRNLFNRGGNIEEARKKIFLDVYGRKLQVLKLYISVKIMERYESVLQKIHRELDFEIDQLTKIESDVKIYENHIMKHQDEYTAQNIEIYYNNIVKDIICNLEKKYGEAFYLEEEYIGNMLENIKSGTENLVFKLTQFCYKYILTDKKFSQTFEEEFNERANINITDLKSKVLSKEDIYRRLYNILDSNSALKIYLMNYGVNAYQEKYFFGDYSSNFIKYAFDFDRKTRNYKIGYVHETRSGGIEKLNLMGGFGAKDIIYIRASINFYNYCLENGYLLHRVDVELLPDIN